MTQMQNAHSYSELPEIVGADGTSFGTLTEHRNQCKMQQAAFPRQYKSRLHLNMKRRWYSPSSARILWKMSPVSLPLFLSMRALNSNTEELKGFSMLSSDGEYLAVGPPGESVIMLVLSLR